mgnify:CR=1 FL=1
MKPTIHRGALLLVALSLLIAGTSISTGCAEIRRGASGVLPYHERNFTVSPLSEQTLSLELTAGDSPEGSVQVVTGGNLDIDFYVTDPYGNTVYSAPGRLTGKRDFFFTAGYDGYYTLRFSNKFSVFTSKSVAVKYRRT